MQRSREDWQTTVGRSGLWTGFRVALSAIQAIQLGFKVYLATDACGDLNTKPQDTAVLHMIQTGARPMECSQVLAGLRQHKAYLIPDVHIPLYQSTF